MARRPLPPTQPPGQGCPPEKGEQGNEPGCGEFVGGEGFVGRPDSSDDGFGSEIDREPDQESYGGKRCFQQEYASFHQSIPEGRSQFVFRRNPRLPSPQDPRRPFVGPNLEARVRYLSGDSVRSHAAPLAKS